MLQPLGIGILVYRQAAVSFFFHPSASEEFVVCFVLFVRVCRKIFGKKRLQFPTNFYMRAFVFFSTRTTNDNTPPTMTTTFIAPIRSQTTSIVTSKNNTMLTPTGAAIFQGKDALFDTKGRIRHERHNALRYVKRSENFFV